MANMEPVPASNIPNATAESQPLPSTHPDEDLALVRACKNDAHEVVQKAFFKAYQKLHQFRETARFSTWLIRIFVNESLMEVRKLRQAREFPVKDLELERESLPFGMTNWEPNTEELCSASELAKILRKCLDELNPYLR
jgi:RNA polymerase sigma-70 factor (ECF subfamily)